MIESARDKQNLNAHIYSLVISNVYAILADTPSGVKCILGNVDVVDTNRAQALQIHRDRLASCDARGSERTRAGTHRPDARRAMLFDVPRIIEYLSQGYTLQPGDVIVAGSPGALPLRPGEKPEKPVGKVIVPGQLHMRPGDVGEVEVDGLGVLSNPVIEDPTPLR
jgi:2-keto-4-pentenoate hydratase/2-oxohepta-3-ene-1,7-dioic acid hydratase in catechol pathway